MDTFLNEVCMSEYDGEGYFNLVQTREHDDELILTFELPYGNSNNKVQTWEIKCRDIVDRSINSYSYNNIKLTDEHVLLWKYTQEVYELLINGKGCSNKSQLVGDLFFSHNKLVDDWIPFGKYIKPLDSYSKLLEHGYGAFAKGPEQLMRVYHEVIAKYELNPYFFIHGKPKYWDGHAWVEENRKLSVLEFDNSYIIAGAFEATKIK